MLARTVPGAAGWEASSPQRVPHRLDDAILSRFLEVGVHGQAYHLLGQPFAHRRAAERNGKVLVRLLAMQRNRVVDRGRNALGLERRRKPVTPAAGKPEGILRPYRGRTE